MCHFLSFSWISSSNNENLKLVWDDDEERRYREWLHSVDVRRNSAQGKSIIIKFFLIFIIVFQSNVVFKIIILTYHCVSIVDWTELQNEEQYRQKLRDEQDARENQLIVWDDEREREFRQKYINQRSVSRNCV